MRDHFVLKGAQMLRVWTNSPFARPTMDIDLLGRVRNKIENLEEIVRQCCAVEVLDGVIFDPQTVRGERIKKDAEYQGVRVFIRGFLGKIRLAVQIDFGFGDVVVPAPIEIVLPQLLDLGSPKLFGYTPESSVAEKFQAIVALDLTNTRCKDFYDIALLSRSVKFNSEMLTKAIEATFAQRNTPLPEMVPNALTKSFTANENKQKQWQGFLRKNRLEESMRLQEAAQLIKEFLMPLVKDCKKQIDLAQSSLYSATWYFINLITSISPSDYAPLDQLTK